MKPGTGGGRGAGRRR